MKIFIIACLLIAYLLGNYYVFHKAWIMIPTSTWSRIILIVFAVIVLSSFLLFYTLGGKLPIKISTLLYEIGNSWLIAFLYFFLIFLFSDLIKIFHLVPESKFTQYTKDNGLTFALITGFVFLLMVAGYLKYRIKERVDLSIEVAKSLGNTQSLKIIALSDLHLGYSIGKQELQTWVNLINKEKPDIVLIPGDVVDCSLDPLYTENMSEEFLKIESKYGVYATLGNHEYISDVVKSSQFFEQSGIKLLKDSVLLVDNSFYIVGRDDKTNPNRKTLRELVDSVDKTKPIILLDHQPYNLTETANNGIDLQISGHTHRGQIWPISLITDWIFEDSYGYLKKHNTHIYVSSGIGIWGGKFRIGTQSEYVKIELKSK